MLTDSERALLRKALNMLMDLLSTEEASPPAPDSEEAQMVDVPTAAKRMGVSTSFVYRAVRTGKLAAHRIGSTIRFYPTELDAYIRANERDVHP